MRKRAHVLQMAKTGRKVRSYWAGAQAEDRLVEALDELSAFDRYRVLQEKIRKAQKEGFRDEDIPEMMTELRLRQLSIAIAHPNSAVALTAGRDLLDRNEGKAPKRKKTKCVLEIMDSTELDTILGSLLRSSVAR